jgi:ribonuclease P protein component
LIGRIRERDAFLRLRRDGVRVRIDPLWCSFVPDSEVVPPQVAFAIGRATGSAVQRNLLRRRLRAILRDREVPAGLLLIGANAQATERTFADLEQCLTNLLVKVAARSTTALSTPAQSTTAP